MSYGSKKISLKNRRAVSQIIGSLIVLAVVASVGSVILFQGLNQINAFNYDLSFHDREHSETLREDILFEHIRFDTTGTGDELVLYLANIGSIDSTIATLTVVNIDTQELIIKENVNQSIQIESHLNFTKTANLVIGSDNIWNSTEYRDSDYKVSITTSKGNFFFDVVTPPGMFES